MTLTVSARLFSAAAIFALIEETRYYLQGVYVHPHPAGGAVLVATDGHRMMVIHDEAGGCNKPAIVSTDKKMRAALRSAAKGATVDVDAYDQATVGGVPVVNAGVVDGAFPDYTHILRQVRDMAKSKQNGVATFNAHYLADFERAASILSASTRLCTLRVIAYGTGEPAIINFPDCDHALGVLMGMKHGENLNALPGFLKPLLEGAEKRRVA